MNEAVGSGLVRIAVFGLGYVGLVTAVCHADSGHQVIGVEHDSRKLDRVGRGVSPIGEPGVESLLAKALSAGAFALTRDVRRAVSATEMALICVGTPSSMTHGTDLTAVLSVIREIATALHGAQRDYTVVLRSTVPPGTTKGYVAPELKRVLGRAHSSDVALYFNPEFLRQGSAIADFRDPPFTVLGTHDGNSPPSGAATSALGADSGVSQVVLNYQEAELLKIACNAFHALKIDFANEIGTLAGHVDADPRRVMNAFKMDTKLNISAAYLRPGFAFGGSCLPKDVRSLIHVAGKQGLRLPVAQSILPSNDAHLDRITEHVVGLGSKTIGMVGITFKANTDDLRESAAMRLIERLRGAGKEVFVYEPEIRLDTLVGTNLDYLRSVLPDYVERLVDWSTLLTRVGVLLITRSGLIGSKEIAKFGRSVIDIDGNWAQLGQFDRD